ncbi:arginine utilization regulatory protein RocR [Peptococcaceae bacterium CEB3]|nr:arginine utilization regulatory protein RocR [Peptococcaceae bacterium CEB3]
MLTRLQVERLAREGDNAVIAIDGRGKIAVFNEAAAKLLGITKDEALGLAYGQVLPDIPLSEVRQRQVPSFNLMTRIGGKQVVVSSVPYRSLSGRVGGVAAFIRNMDEFESLSAQVNNLREAGNLLTAIINSTQDAISVADEDGVGILVNPAYTRLTGLTAEDVLGKPPTVDMAEGGESMHMKVLRTGKAVKGISMKVGPKRKEVIVNVAPILAQGRLLGSVGVLQDVSEIRKLSDELEGAKRIIRHLEAKYTFTDIIGESEAIRATVEQAQRAAATPATVLLRGESGTGKELFAHAIHRLSSRPKGQFIRVNCAALSDSLLESELFGYVEGAFTGAKRGGKVGLFEEANGGTIFLDEIGEISLNLQTKLLRVLQEREIVRVGANQPVSVDVRVIAATNANLEEALRLGKFREDLYYRLNVIPVLIPPLRQRRADMPLLVHHLIRRFNQEYGRGVEKVTDEALEVLSRYQWPGNVRELENVLGRAIINMRVGDTVMEAGYLPPLDGRQGGGGQAGNGASNPAAGGRPDESSYAELQFSWEEEVLRRALREAGGNKTQAARNLKISIRNFYYKLRRHGLA